MKTISAKKAEKRKDLAEEGNDDRLNEIEAESCETAKVPPTEHDLGKNGVAIPKARYKQWMMSKLTNLIQDVGNLDIADDAASTQR